MFYLTDNVREYSLNNVMLGTTRTLDGAWLADKLPIHVRHKDAELVDCNCAETMAKIVNDSTSITMDSKFTYGDFTITYGDLIKAISAYEAGLKGQAILDGRHSGLGHVAGQAILLAYPAVRAKVPNAGFLAGPRVTFVDSNIDEIDFAIRMNLANNASRGMGKVEVLTAMLRRGGYNKEADVPSEKRGLIQFCWRGYWIETQLRKLPAKQRTTDYETLCGIAQKGLAAVFGKFQKSGKKTPLALKLKASELALEVQSELTKVLTGKEPKAKPILKTDSIHDLLAMALLTCPNDNVCKLLQGIVDDDNGVCEAIIASLEA